jgi:hypothetical protein
MLSLRRRLAALALAASLVPVPTLSFAQSDADKATARMLGQEGQKALEARDYATAEDRFRRAESLYHAPTLALGLARALAAQGKVVAAQETYNRIVREGAPPNAPDAFKRAIEDAKREVEQVTPRIAAVTINVSGAPNPTVTLDDAPVPNAALGVKRPVDPGTHVVRATADGFKPAETTFNVSEGAAATASLTLEKDLAAVATGAPSASPDTGSAGANGSSVAVDTSKPPSGKVQRTAGWVALGVGGAALAAGAITGFIALGKKGELSDKCPNGVCPSDEQSAVDSYRSTGTLSTIFFIVGGVAAAGGAVLLFTAPKDAPAAQAKNGSHRAAAASGTYVTPYVGLGSAGLVGRF